ncbi:RCC1/BLIP-II [Aulographum hederae CBS 113979]|uniref:RCC1/BLIP-II n=1 Tax=Aulographum hederae CBS 113979 TaxID=1176131 RepID=A0A6G1GS57_9PEZI|nr:RCC1/BLIP-II [Aulographum hederae CBS 113979]
MAPKKQKMPETNSRRRSTRVVEQDADKDDEPAQSLPAPSRKRKAAVDDATSASKKPNTTAAKKTQPAKPTILTKAEAAEAKAALAKKRKDAKKEKKPVASKKAKSPPAPTKVTKTTTTTRKARTAKSPAKSGTTAAKKPAVKKGTTMTAPSDNTKTVTRPRKKSEWAPAVPVETKPAAPRKAPRERHLPTPEPKAPAKAKPAPKGKAALKDKAPPKTTAAPKDKAPTKATTAPTSKTPAPEVAAPSKTKTPSSAINTPPTTILKFFVFGENGFGELGLGANYNNLDVQRPRYNKLLAPETVGVVELAAGAMHCVALTHDNRILTWGVNDKGALGRPTKNEDMYPPEVPREDLPDEEDSDSGMNIYEVKPMEVDSKHFPDGTTFAKVAAGDSCSFVLTTTGELYGWGSFLDINSNPHFIPGTPLATTPIPIGTTIDHAPFVDISIGSNHALAVDTDGVLYSWGNGEAMQLGRKIVDRNQNLEEDLVPRRLPVGPRGANKVKRAFACSHQSFAVTTTGDVYGWGPDGDGQVGFKPTDEMKQAVVNPMKIPHLSKKGVVAMTGGEKHSVALTDKGDVLTFGRLEVQLGLNKEKLGPEGIIHSEEGVGTSALLHIPTAIPDLKATMVASAGHHNIAITKDNKAVAWGVNNVSQLGQGKDADDNIPFPKQIADPRVKDLKLVWCGTGYQYGMVACEYDPSAEPAPVQEMPAPDEDVVMQDAEPTTNGANGV